MEGNKMIKRSSVIILVLLLVLALSCSNGALSSATSTGAVPLTGEIWKVNNYGSQPVAAGTVTITLNSDGTGSQVVSGGAALTFNYTVSGSQFYVSNLVLAAGAASYLYNGSYAMTKSTTSLKLIPLLDTTGMNAKTIEAIK